MNAPPSNAPLPGKASFTFWLLAALLLLILALVGFSLFGPNPPIEIGKATTHITTPLDANGLPDYAAALLAKSRKGVTPENNGAVPFLMAMWPEEGSDEAYSAEDAKLLCAELGLSGVPPKKGRITSLYSDKYRLAALRLLRERLPKPGESSKKSTATDPDDVAFYREHGMEVLIQGPEEDFFNDPESEAVQDGRVINLLNSCELLLGPWTAEELPFFATWLEENDAVIDLLVEAAERPKWYLPDPELLRAESGAVAGAWEKQWGFWWSSAAPDDLLVMRSGYFQGEERYDEAARDALAILRLAHHKSKESGNWGQNVAIELGEVGLSTIDRIAADKATPVGTLRFMLKQLDAIGTISQMADSIDHAERFQNLDFVIYSYEWRSSSWTGIDGIEALGFLPCDWNPAMRAINAHHDALLMAAKLPTWTQRQAAIERIESAIPSIDFPPQSTREWLGLASAKGRGGLFADVVVGVLAGNTAAYYKAEDRVRNNRQLTRLGIALAIYRAEQGAYPATLAELVPSVLQKLPVDLFYDNPFAYKKADNGYLLYSLGANGTDEGGSNLDITWGMPKLEGVEVEDSDFDDTNESDWDENGKYIGGSMAEPEGDLDNPFAKIPAGADDLSLRVPLPEPEPWPWETVP